MSRGRLVVRAWAAAVLVWWPAAAPAAGAADDPAPVTWAVAPADDTGPDGRSWVELTLDPGETSTEHLAVTNLADVPVTFGLYGADGYLTPTGRFSMLPGSQESVAAGTWIDVRDSIEVAPGATEVVPFTVTVPGDAAPGDHPAGIAATVVSLPGGGGVGVEGRVGFRVLTRVTGELAPALDITDQSIEYSYSWNPFAPGSATVTYAVANAGNTRLSAEQSIRTSGLLGDDAAASVDAIDEMFAGETRGQRIEVRRMWPLGPITATITVDAAVLPSGEAEIAPVTVEARVWVVPWPQLVLLVVLAGAGAAVPAVRRRRRLAWEDRIAAAREQGRAEALADGGRA